MTHYDEMTQEEKLNAINEAVDKLHAVMLPDVDKTILDAHMTLLRGMLVECVQQGLMYDSVDEMVEATLCEMYRQLDG